jgi:hypothetical protein
MNHRSAATEGSWVGRYVGALSGAGFVALFLVMAVVSNVATTAIYPRPNARAEEVLRYFSENAAVVGALSLTHVAGALLLLLFTGVIASAVRDASDRGSPEADWAALGGALAAASLLVGALLMWALSRGEVLSVPEGTVLVHQAVFAAGGTGHVAPLGLMVGATSLAALRHQLHPRWLATLGLVSGALSLSSLASMVVDAAVLLIPAGRFTAFVYIIAVSVLLARGRLARPERLARTAPVAA